MNEFLAVIFFVGIIIVMYWYLKNKPKTRHTYSDKMHDSAYSRRRRELEAEEDFRREQEARRREEREDRARYARQEKGLKKFFGGRSKK